MPDDPITQPQTTEAGVPVLTEPRPPRPWLELTVVLLFGVVTHLINALVPVLFDPGSFDGTSAMPFAIESVMHIGASVSLIAGILWIMRQSGRHWSFYGFVRPRAVKDLGSGAGLYALNWIVYIVFGTAIATVLWNLGLDLEDTDAFESGALARPTHPLDLPMILLMSVFNATSEQLVITAYLISTLRTLLGHAVPALAISVALFASYHIYQGPWGVISAGTFGLIFGAYFCLTRRIWPCIAAHCLADIVPYVIAYLEA